MGAPQTGRVSLTLLCSALLCSALLCSLSMSAKAHIVKPLFTAGSPLLWQFQRKTDLRSTGPMGRRLAAGWLKPLQAGPCSFASPPYDGSANDISIPRIYQFLRFFARAGPHILRRILCRIFGNDAKKQSLLRFRMQLFVYELESAVR